MIILLVNEPLVANFVFSVATWFMLSNIPTWHLSPSSRIDNCKPPIRIWLNLDLSQITGWLEKI